MQIRSTVTALAVVFGLMLTTASAQDATRVAIANPGRILEKLQERADAQAALDGQLTRLNQEQALRKLKIDKLKSELGMMKSDAPQYSDKQQELLKESIDYSTWIQMSQLDVQRQQKKLMVSLYNRIIEGVRKVAEKEKIDFVIAEQGIEIPANLEQITPDALKAALSSRNVLFSSGKSDITQQVIDLLNLEYAARGPAGTP